MGGRICPPVVVKGFDGGDPPLGSSRKCLHILKACLSRVCSKSDVCLGLCGGFMFEAGIMNTVVCLSVMTPSSSGVPGLPSRDGGDKKNVGEHIAQ